MSACKHQSQSRSMSLSIDVEVQDLFRTAYENEGTDRNRAAEEAFRLYAEKHSPGAIIEDLKNKIQDYEARIKVLEPELNKINDQKESDAYKFLLETFRAGGYLNEDSNKIVNRRWIGFLCDRMRETYNTNKESGIKLIRKVVGNEIIGGKQKERFWEVLEEIK